jgi:hypothetical protein
MKRIRKNEVVNDTWVKKWEDSQFDTGISTCSISVSVFGPELLLL